MGSYSTIRSGVPVLMIDFFVIQLFFTHTLRRRVVQTGDSIEYMTDSSLDSLPFIDDEDYEDTREIFGTSAAKVVMCRAFIVHPESLKQPKKHLSMGFTLMWDGTDFFIPM